MQDGNKHGDSKVKTTVQDDIQGKQVNQPSVEKGKETTQPGKTTKTQPKSTATQPKSTLQHQAAVSSAKTVPLSKVGYIGGVCTCSRRARGMQGTKKKKKTPKVFMKMLVPVPLFSFLFCREK